MIDIFGLTSARGIVPTDFSTFKTFFNSSVFGCRVSTDLPVLIETLASP